MTRTEPTRSDDSGDSGGSVDSGESDGKAPFDPPIAAASLSGRSDAAWARTAAPYVGCAFLGGIALDPASRSAARDLVDRDREEFLPADPIAFVDAQLEALADADVRPGINVRSATIDPIYEVARRCVDHGAILEINAHCRQPELCAVGCGESLLADLDRLSRYVEAASEPGATVSVKVRAEVPEVDLAEVATAIETAGAEIMHVDAMDTEGVIADVDRAADLWIIANNEVRDHGTVREYLEYGADAVSVGRPSGDPAVLERVERAVAEIRTSSGAERRSRREDVQP
ncbi:tRNA-dihydrouridine synthase [Halopenitus sp. H-Gu1]|uniref:tRNA-dihydrouridine synthase n=1 Tax=Halopenitus sp. H-Gu1 TaxID=3242697 RepID=UPI00359F11E4